MNISCPDLVQSLRMSEHNAGALEVPLWRPYFIAFFGQPLNRNIAIHGSQV